MLTPPSCALKKPTLRLKPIALECTSADAESANNRSYSQDVRHNICMTNRRKRSRSSSDLVKQAWERFYGCEVCLKSCALSPIEVELVSLRLKQRESTRLFQKLTCPHCESRIGMSTRVAAPTAEQSRQSRLSSRFDSLYRADFETFRSSLIRFSMLGASHPFGKLLTERVNRARKISLKPSTWYRATSVCNEPHFAPRQGEDTLHANRFNQVGQAAWYLGCDAKTAAVEKLRAPKSDHSICIAEIRILDPIPVLDLRSVLWGEQHPTGDWILSNVVDRRLISEPTADCDDSRPQYRVPQFVADLARRRGFGGILYNSTRPSAYNNADVVGHNLVVFAPFPSFAVENPRTVAFSEPDYDSIWAAERWPLYESSGSSELLADTI
jgi:hypothetical protein